MDFPKTPFGTVPEEVREAVTEYLPALDGRALSRVCRGLRAAGTRLLYSDIIFDWGDDIQPPPVQLLLRTILVSPDKIPAVRSLSLQGRPLNLWRKEIYHYSYPKPDKPKSTFSLDSFTLQELDLYFATLADTALGGTVPPRNTQLAMTRAKRNVLLVLVCQLRQLQRLVVSNDIFLLNEFGFELGVHLRSKRLHNIQHLRLCYDKNRIDWRDYCKQEREKEYRREWEEVLAAGLRLPKIKSLTLGGKLEHEEDLYPSDLEHLHLMHSWESHNHFLKEHLGNFPRLRSLDIELTASDYAAKWGLLVHWPNSGVPGEDIHLDNFRPPDSWSEPLSRVSHSLEALKINWSFVWHDDWSADGLDFDDSYDCSLVWGSLGTLQHFTNLRCLTIPQALLIGYSAALFDLRSWDDKLPRSLRDITWLSDELEMRYYSFAWPMSDLLSIMIWFAQWFIECRSYPKESLRFHYHVDQARFNWPFVMDGTEIPSAMHEYMERLNIDWQAPILGLRGWHYRIKFDFSHVLAETLRQGRPVLGLWEHVEVD